MSEKAELIEFAQALLKALEEERFEDAQHLAYELDYRISQLPQPDTSGEGKW